jgi:hypothetical protein
MAQCEFCLREAKYTATTEFNGGYCEDCLRLVIASTRTALKEIKAKRMADKDIAKQALEVK